MYSQVAHSSIELLDHYWIDPSHFPQRYSVCNYYWLSSDTQHKYLWKNQDQNLEGVLPYLIEEILYWML